MDYKTREGFSVGTNINEIIEVYGFPEEHDI